MNQVWLSRSFPAAHRIRIAGQLEPWHGHDFRVELLATVEDERDPSALAPQLEAVLEELKGTRLEAVERGEGGAASAERTARHVFRRLEERWRGDPRVRVSSVTVHESPGAAATWRRPPARPEAAAGAGAHTPAEPARAGSLRVL